MEFASKYVLDCSSDSESLSDEDLQYSADEARSDGSDDSESEEVDQKAAQAERQKMRTEKVRKADTNVVAITLRTLSEAAELLTGDPIFCKSCSAVLNRLSKVTDREKEGEGEGDEPEGSREWLCEFCGASNSVNIDDEEIPTGESGDYILDTVSTNKESPVKPGATLTVFCIDISGSMCVTTEVAGSHKLKGHERVGQLNSLNTERVDQYWRGQNKNTTWISRLQCVQAAVDASMEKLTQEAPEALVAIVTFNNDVTIVGDGSQTPVTVTGDKLYQFDALLEAGANAAVRRPIKDSQSALSKHLFSIEETGATALGPALLVSLGIAGQVPGAQVVLCTDGLANVGLGAQDELRTEKEKQDISDFYENMGSFAADKGISVSVVSIKGTEAKMENLGKLADNSGGQVNVVDPLNLHKEFASILADQVIATNVTVDFVLHKGLYFRNEADLAKDAAAAPAATPAAAEAPKLDRKASKEKKRRELVEKKRLAAEKKAKEQGAGEPKKKRSFFGSKRNDKAAAAGAGAGPEAEVEAEAAPPAAEEKDKERAVPETPAGEVEAPSTEKESLPEPIPDVHKRVATRHLGNVTKETQITFEFGADHKQKVPEGVKEMPFQVQIRFTTLDGKRCIRSITKSLETTKDREVAEKDANIQILGLNIAQQSAKMAFDGEYTGARLNTYANKKLLKRAKKTGDDEAYYSSWKSNLNKMDRKLQTAQFAERKQGRNYSDEERDDDDAAAPSSRSRSTAAPAKCKVKTAVRTETRNDEMSTYLYQMKSAKPTWNAKKK